jgi:hypothetical protein
MNITEYYSVLGLKQGASISEIKKAYRIKALQYHPDRNTSPDAAEMFVRVSEAYQYLIGHQGYYGRSINPDFEKNYAAWVEYRRERAKQEAENYARASFEEFKKSSLYKSAHSIDGNMLFFGFGLSIFIIVFSLYGYFYRVSVATSERDMPSLPLMLLTLVMGFSFLTVTILYFIAWRADKKSEKDGKKSEGQKSV